MYTYYPPSTPMPCPPPYFVACNSLGCVYPPVGGTLPNTIPAKLL